MAYAEKRRNRWRCRYQRADGAWGSSGVDDQGTAFRTKQSALEWGRDKEAKIRQGLDAESAPSVAEAARRARRREGITLWEWAQTWFPRQDVAPATAAAYRTYLEVHILPHQPHGGPEEWKDSPIADITDDQVLGWERSMEAAGVAAASRRTYRTVLHTLLEDAVEAGHIPRNPVARRRGRGRKSGKGGGTRGPEKATVDPLQALLLAERAALLSGRDDEFVMLVTKAWTGMRFAELVGLDRAYVRQGEIRVEQQLYELSGQWYRQAPKDDSYRTVDVPDFLADLLAAHLDARPAAPTDRCPCLAEESPAPPHRGGVWVFRGPDQGRGTSSGATLKEVAAHAGVSTGTASSALRGSPAVAEDTRLRVESAAAELGYTGAQRTRTLGSPHLRRNDFDRWVFRPASSGAYPPKGPERTRPVPVAAEPWPGVPLRGRGARDRADGRWEPIKDGLTPHGLRHSHRTWLTEDGVPEVLSHERLGHELGGMAAVYTHVTPAMRTELAEALTARWRDALRRRADLAPRSPVAVLDRLLAGLRETGPEIISQPSPTDTKKAVTPLRLRREITA